MPGIIVAIFMLLLSVPAQSAPEGYENCTELNRYCVSPERTRIINGYPVHAACWQYYINYSCDKKTEVKNSCSVFENNPDDIARTCRKTRQNCFKRNPLRSAFCDEFEEEWACHYPFDIKFDLDDPFNKSIRLDDPNYNPERQKFLDTGAEERSARVYTGNTVKWRFFTKNTSETFSQRPAGRTERQIKALCSVSPTCTETPGSFKCTNRGHYLNWRSHLDSSRGSVGANCWRWSVDYSCRQEEFTNDCQHLHDDASCTQQSVDCIANDEDGNCTNYVYEYQCGANIEGSSTQVCGSSNWCIDDDCTSLANPEPNTAFGRATASMKLLEEISKDFMPDGDDLRIFTGKVQSCSKWILGLKNCCKTGGLLLDTNLAECSESERELAVKRSTGQAHYTGSHCSSKTFFGSCLVRKSDFCTFNSRLARVLQEQGRSQLGISWNNCRGLTPEELEMIDWSHVDLREVLPDIEAQMSIPNQEALKLNLQQKVEDFYNDFKASDNSNGDNDE